MSVTRQPQIAVITFTSKPKRFSAVVKILEAKTYMDGRPICTAEVSAYFKKTNFTTENNTNVQEGAANRCTIAATATTTLVNLVDRRYHCRSNIQRPKISGGRPVPTRLDSGDRVILDEVPKSLKTGFTHR